MLLPNNPQGFSTLQNAHGGAGERQGARPGARAAAV